MSKDLQINIMKKQRKASKKMGSVRYQDLAEKEKDKKWGYGCKQYKNFPEHEKQRLVEYRKKYKM